MSQAIGYVVLNAGSSSIKFAVYEPCPRDDLRLALRGQVSGIGLAPHLTAQDGAGRALAPQVPPAERHDHEQLLDWLLEWIASHDNHRIVAVGHRVVHGGEHFVGPTVVGEREEAALAALSPLAPLHQPHNVAAIAALRKARPGLPQVACFDTAFHVTIDPLEQLFALPREYAAAGLRRYGFHGLSYEYIASRLPRYLDDRSAARVLVAHLGNGSSACALRDGRSVATTMGFSTLDGLMMGTRCGTLDAGAILYLLQEKRMSADEVCDLLYKRSGLLGVSGITSDMKALLEDERPAARQAVDLYVARLNRELGGLAAVLGGVDALVFTGGIGEHAAPVRARLLARAAWLGSFADEQANASNASCISTAHSRTPVYVIPTDEERMIADHMVQVLAEPLAA